MRCILVLVGVALLVGSGSATASETATAKGTVRIAGDARVLALGTGWRPFETMVVRTRVGDVAKAARFRANRYGRWRLVVYPYPAACDLVVVTATGARSGTTRTLRRPFGACPPPQP